MAKKTGMVSNLNECVLSGMALYISQRNDKLLQLTRTDSQLIKNVITYT